MLKNIPEFPQSIQSVVTEFANKVLENLNDNVHAILVYGSAAGVNYHQGASDINLAIIVKNLDFSVLKESISLVKWGHKHKIATPLFLSREYMLSSLDVFPIEFTEIKEQHRVIYGEDVFANLDIPVRDIALLCEQQVKGKLLHLRQAYLELGSNPLVLKNLLMRTLNDLTPVFRQLIVLKGQGPDIKKEEMYGQLAKIYSLAPEPFIAVYHDKDKKFFISLKDVEAHLQNFLDQLEKLSRHLDSL